MIKRFLKAYQIFFCVGSQENQPCFLIRDTSYHFRSVITSLTQLKEACGSFLICKYVRTGKFDKFSPAFSPIRISSCLWISDMLSDFLKHFLRNLNSVGELKGIKEYHFGKLKCIK